MSLLRTPKPMSQPPCSFEFSHGNGSRRSPQPQPAPSKLLQKEGQDGDEETTMRGQAMVEISRASNSALSAVASVLSTKYPREETTTTAPRSKRRTSAKMISSNQYQSSRMVRIPPQQEQQLEDMHEEVSSADRYCNPIPSQSNSSVVTAGDQEPHYYKNYHQMQHPQPFLEANQQHRPEFMASETKQHGEQEEKAGRRDTPPQEQQQRVLQRRNHCRNDPRSYHEEQDSAPRPSTAVPKGECFEETLSPKCNCLEREDQKRRYRPSAVASRPPSNDRAISNRMSSRDYPHGTEEAVTTYEVTTESRPPPPQFQVPQEPSHASRMAPYVVVVERYYHYPLPPPVSAHAVATLPSSFTSSLPCIPSMSQDRTSYPNTSSHYYSSMVNDDRNKTSSSNHHLRGCDCKDDPAQSSCPKNNVRVLRPDPAKMGVEMTANGDAATTEAQPPNTEPRLPISLRASSSSSLPEIITILDDDDEEEEGGKYMRQESTGGPDNDEDRKPSPGPSPTSGPSSAREVGHPIIYYQPKSAKKKRKIEKPVYDNSSLRGWQSPETSTNTTIPHATGPEIDRNMSRQKRKKKKKAKNMMQEENDENQGPTGRSSASSLSCLVKNETMQPNSRDCCGIRPPKNSSHPTSGAPIYDFTDKDVLTGVRRYVFCFTVCPRSLCSSPLLDP